MTIIRNKDGSYTAAGMICGQRYSVTMTRRADAIDGFLNLCVAQAVGL